MTVFSDVFDDQFGSLSGITAMTDYTYLFGDEGFLLNTDFTNTLPFFDVTEVDGLDTAPIRQNTDEHEGMDGTYVDAEFLSMRTIVITGNLYTDPNDPETACDILRAEYGPSPVQKFYFQLPGKSLRFVNAKGGGAKYNQDTSRSFGMTQMQLTLLAGDPYIYDFPAQVQSIPIGAGGSVGIGFNMGFNTGFGGTLTQPSVTVTNNGSHVAYPVIELDGPLTNPVVQDVANGFSMAFNITLAASDSLVIDCRNKKVTLNGSVSRRQALVGLNWSTVPVNGNNTFQLSADSGSGSMTVTLYSTYY